MSGVAVCHSARARSVTHCVVAGFARISLMLDVRSAAFLNLVSAVVHEQMAKLGGVVASEVNGVFYLAWPIAVSALPRRKTKAIESASRILAAVAGAAAADARLSEFVKKNLNGKIPNVPVYEQVRRGAAHGMRVLSTTGTTIPSCDPCVAG